jgi:hypothetical protein
LQLLSVPFHTWSDISVDYITPLSVCKWQGAKYKHLLVVVCHLIKIYYFILVTELSAEELVTAFINYVYSLHGCSENIVSDCGTQFVSQFWRYLSEQLEIALQSLSVFHSETDGQIERINTEIEQYLYAFMSFYQDN